MDEDRNLYLVEYARITFKDYNGSTNSSYKKMENIVKKGSTFTLPSVPQVSNYRNTGWAKTKNTSSAAYGSREKITVKNSMTLYAAREYLAYAVTFNNNTGTSKDKAFKNLYVRAAKKRVCCAAKGSFSKGLYKCWLGNKDKTDKRSV